MLFTHDTEVALQGAAALVNTGRSLLGEQLRTVADLDEFVQAWGWTGQRRHSKEELESVRALRSRLEGWWAIDEDGAVELVNRLLLDANALPQLVKHDDWDYHLHATPPEAPLADRMAVEAAMAMADVIRAKELGRLHICAADDCIDVMVDLSKNRSRRFCSAGCANRMNVAAYRARQTATRANPSGT